MNTFRMKPEVTTLSIRIEKIAVQNSKYELHFHVDGNSRPFFKENVYKGGYDCDGAPLDLSSVPESVLVIPFLCDVLPIIWLEDDTLFVDSVDEDFYNCIKDIQNEYCAVFGELFGGGRICTLSIEKNTIGNRSRRSGLFYSGGVDSNYSLLSHLDERPILQLVWGNMDMHYENEEGFQRLYRNAQATAGTYGVPLIVIHSNYRCILNRVALNAKYEGILKIRWWLGVQHLLALSGLSAPCNYVKNIATQYVAPTYSEEMKIEHTRYPENVDVIRYFGCQIHQDPTIMRQEKVKVIVDEVNRSGHQMELHVCFRAQNGENCCTCEKCATTILELMAEGADPSDYGFNIDESIINACIQRCNRKEYDLNVTPFLDSMKARLKKNAAVVKHIPYGDAVLDGFCIPDTNKKM